MLYFLLSYARGEDDPYVAHFYDDLCTEVRSLTGARSDEQVGFLDTRNIPLGSSWPAELVDALSSCQCLLALCSPGYFKSESCGREWAVFAERLDEYERVNGTRPRAMLPLRWVLETDLPPFVQDIQYDTAALGVAYRRNGLRRLLQQRRRYKDRYLDFVSELASRIVAIAKEYRLPRMTASVEFRSIPSAFHPTQAEASSSYVHFVIAASSRAEMEAVRERLEYYGDSHEDWAPYHPRLPRPLGAYAQQIATEQRFSSELTDITDLVARLDEASRSNQIVVILVDAWAVRIQRYSDTLSQYDRRNEPTSAVIIPWSTDDEELQRRHLVLASAVHSVFPQNVKGDEEMFQGNVRNHDDFGVGLQKALTKAQSRVFRLGPVRYRPQGPSPGDRPVLEAP